MAMSPQLKITSAVSGSILNPAFLRFCKSDGVMGVCVHPMAQPRLGRWPAGVTNAVCPHPGSHGRGSQPEMWYAASLGGPRRAAREKAIAQGLAKLVRKATSR